MAAAAAAAGELDAGAEATVGGVKSPRDVMVLASNVYIYMAAS